MENYTIRPVMWEHKKNKQGTCPIMLAVTINRVVTYKKTGYRVKKSQWDKEEKSVINYPNESLVNADIRKKISDIERELISHSLEGKKITRRVIKGDSIKDKSFVKFANEIRKNDKEVNRIIQYAGAGLLITDIDPTFLRKYEQHERKREMAQNTLNTTFKYLRRIIRQAKAEGLIKENPFDDFIIPKYEQSDRVYLTDAERAKLLLLLEDKNKDLNESLKITLTYFLFGCYSGLRHSDWSRFDISKMYDGKLIKLRAKKNKQHVVLPVGPTLSKLIDRMRELPPPASNQKCNVMLKAISGVAKIKKDLTTHAARHSFGYLCATNKLPKSVTAELLGVTTKTVEVYYHLSGENIIKQAEVLGTL